MIIKRIIIGSRLINERQKKVCSSQLSCHRNLCTRRNLLRHFSHVVYGTGHHFSFFYFTISRSGRKVKKSPFFLATDELNFNFHCSQIFSFSVFPLLIERKKLFLVCLNGNETKKFGLILLLTVVIIHTHTSLFLLSLTNQQTLPLLLTAWGPWLSILADDAEWPQLQFISLGLAHTLADHNNQHDEHGQKHEDTTNSYRHHCTITHQKPGFFIIFEL